MRQLIYAAMFILSSASACQSTMAQQSVLNTQSDEEIEGKLEVQQDQVEPVVRPRLKRVSEISLNLFDQPALNTQGELQVPKIAPMPASNNVTQSCYSASPKVVAWTAPNVGYRRLIFEEPGLERHGFSHPETRQNIVSGAKFYAHAIALPLIIHIQHKYPCDNNLGWGKPGTCPR